MHPLAAQPLGFGEDRGGIGIEHHLQQAVAVAQVDEDHAAVVAAPVHPARNGDGGTDEALVDLAAVMSAHGHG